MKKKTEFVMTCYLLICLTVPVLAEAQIKFRNPVSPSGVSISYFKDNDLSISSAKRYTCDTSKVYENHQGTDFAVPVGTQVYATAKGGLYYRYDSCPTYGSMSSDCGGRYGNHVRIDHESPYDGSAGVVTIYAHMEKGTVSGPSSVLCGAKIGKSGSSGQSSGPHLHFEIRPSGFSGKERRDPFSGKCSQSTSYWTSISSSGMPGTSCQ
jgi:murein DD-endopeptidase MepM/ murein hydrolase activator NlpD